MAAVTVTTGVDFGPGYIGLLGSIGYTVYTLSGSSFSVFQARTTTGIANQGSVVGTTFSGTTGTVYFVAWDTGGVSPVTQWQVVPGQFFQSGDVYALASNLAGMVITGLVAASPAPGASSFTVTLDSPLSVSATSNDLVGLFLTFRSGAREPAAQKITSCTINSTSSVALTFGTAFAGVPAGGDRVMISG